ncbi:hypothetical protein DL765_009466 [Monosporascus sp. GIB2]|nr:hypothetical protein DL765_009466 [Monosporascus sp. GIB2]
MYNQLVAELSGRKLTVADDIFKAFAGLVASMGAAKPELKRRVLKPGTRRIPSWSWCAWDSQVRYTWATFGVLSRLMNCDVTSISSCIPDIFLEDGGSLRRVDRQSFYMGDPSRKPPQRTAADCGICPLGCRPDDGQYLHFKTLVAPAAVFSIDGGQITLSEAGDDWDFFTAPDLK